MKPRAVIFDMDGVLVDSYDAHFQSWCRLARECDLEVTEEQFALGFGRTTPEVMQELWGDSTLPPERLAKLGERKETIYRQIIAREFPVMDGATDLIDALMSAGFAMAIGSSGPPENVRLVLEALDRRSAFRSTVSREQVRRGKPDPQVFQVAAEQLGIEPARCVVIEDAPAGIEAARAAGMPVVGLASTGRTVDELVDADFVVESLRDVSPERIDSLLA